MDVGIDTEKTNPFDSGVENPGYDGTGEQMEMKTRRRGSYDTSSRRGSVETTYAETSFGVDTSVTTPLLREESQENREEAAKIIKSKFPNWNPLDSSFSYNLNSRGEVIAILTDTIKAVPHFIIDADGNVNEKELKASKKIRISLGARAEEIVATNNEKIARRKERIDELQDELATTSNEHMRDNLNQTIAEEQDAINQLERANKEIEQRMTLRDRLKDIFKKYRFTVLAVASAVGVVIGVIVANLKNGLTSLGKGVGNGLKTIGKKLGEIFPGIVGAIASFVFRTAGKVVGFLAKNAWLLIVGVVIYLVEKFKKKK